MDVELAHNTLAMSLHCADSHIEAGGNFFVAKPFGDGDENLTLAIADMGNLRAFTRPSDKLVQGDPSNIGTEIVIPGMDGFDCLGQIVGRGVFQDVATSAGLKDAQNVIRLAVHRENKHLNARKFTSQDL